MTMTGWSRELIFRTFDENMADKIFPQSKGQSLSKQVDDFSTKIIKVISGLLEHQDYVTEKEVLSHMEGSKNHNLRNLKKVLQETIDCYELVRIRLTKVFKERLSVITNGFPYIILKNEIFSQIKNEQSSEGNKNVINFSTVNLSEDVQCQDIFVDREEDFERVA
jgi:hypothetical protein